MKSLRAQTFAALAALSIACVVGLSGGRADAQEPSSSTKLKPPPKPPETPAADERETAQERAVGTVPRLEPAQRVHRPTPRTQSAEIRSRDGLDKPWWQWEHATGDWGGARPWLQGHGIIPSLVYTVELFANVAGGRERDVAVLGDLGLTLTLDTEKLGWWRNGTFFFYFQNHVGAGVTDAVGAVQPVSSLDADPFTQLSAAYYAHDFFDERLHIKLGQSDANVVFDTAEITGEFINGGISPAANIPMPTFPDPRPGLVVSGEPLEWLSLAGAVYGGGVQQRLDADIAQGGLLKGDLFSVVELALKPPTPLSGTYRFAGWILTGGVEDVTGAQNVFDLNYGFYVLFDQQLLLEDRGEPDGQGLSAFFQLSWTPADRNLNDLWVGGGLLYRGLIPGRDDDEVGFAATSAALTRSSVAGGGVGSERVLELFYRVPLTSWLTLQPDLQYIIDPGGSGRNALAIGLRTEVIF